MSQIKDKVKTDCTRTLSMQIKNALIRSSPKSERLRHKTKTLYIFISITNHRLYNSVVIILLSMKIMSTRIDILCFVPLWRFVLCGLYFILFHDSFFFNNI